MAELREKDARPRVPHACSRVLSGGDDTIAIAAERRRIDLILVAFELGNDSARIPDAGGPVLRGGDDAFSVGAECRAIHHEIMSPELDQNRCSPEIPDADHAVPRRGDHARAVGLNAAHRTMLSFSFTLSSLSCA